MKLARRGSLWDSPIWAHQPTLSFCRLCLGNYDREISRVQLPHLVSKTPSCPRILTFCLFQPFTPTPTNLKETPQALFTEGALQIHESDLGTQSAFYGSWELHLPVGIRISRRSGWELCQFRKKAVVGSPLESVSFSVKSVQSLPVKLYLSLIDNYGLLPT